VHKVVSLEYCRIDLSLHARQVLEILNFRVETYEFQTVSSVRRDPRRWGARTALEPGGVRCEPGMAVAAIASRSTRIIRTMKLTCVRSLLHGHRQLHTA
jgi:hypothetical protein